VTTVRFDASVKYYFSQYYGGYVKQGVGTHSAPVVDSSCFLDSFALLVDDNCIIV
jgi:hypothetical protein